MKKQNYVIVAGGCFWGLEDLLAKFKGVTNTEVGYTGGELQNPEYKDVKLGTTGHVEAVKVEFDSNQVDLKEILHYFFKIHDPTTINQQGNDIGSQYRSALFYHNLEQKELFNEVIEEVNKLGRFKGAVRTSLEEEKDFYRAEEFHQKYLEKNPGGYSCHFERS